MENIKDAMLEIRGYSKIHKKCGGKIKRTALGNFLCKECYTFVELKDINLFTSKGNKRVVRI